MVDRDFDDIAYNKFFRVDYIGKMLGTEFVVNVFEDFRDMVGVQRAVYCLSFFDLLFLLFDKVLDLFLGVVSVHGHVAAVHAHFVEVSLVLSSLIDSHTNGSYRHYHNNSSIRSVGVKVPDDHRKHLKHVKDAYKLF